MSWFLSWATGTAQIGDPSGASDTRTMLSAEQVRENAESYMHQFFKVVDADRTRAIYQSTWFGEFTLSTVIELTSHFTVNQFLHRDDFAKRYAERRPIAVTELLYPLLQAYDSVAIEADVEFGGTDQRFNLLVGRELQEKMGQRPQMVFTMPLLPGTDGVRKMSKSLGNYIALEDAPADMFGKLLSLPDHLLPLYYELLTDCPDEEVEGNAAHRRGRGAPGAMELKKLLGVEMVAWFHSPEAAQAAQTEFERVVQGRETHMEVPEFVVSDGVEGVSNIDDEGVHGGPVAAPRRRGPRGEPRRGAAAPRQNAVEVDGVRASGDSTRVAWGAVVRAGRRRYVRVVRG